MGAEAAVGQGPALRGLQGRPVLPARRHRRSPATRSRRATRTSRTRASTSATRSRSRPARCARATTLLVWTTTPWTLVSNAAVAVDPDLTYVRTHRRLRARRGARRARAGRGRRGRRSLHRRARWSAPRYEPPFGFIPASAYGDKGHTVLPADFVSAEDGTGIVHTAIAFGEDDFRLGAEHGLNVVNPVKADGTYDERIGPYAERLRQARRRRPDRGPRGARADVPLRAAAARLPALLALRHAAALLRQADLVHPHVRGQGPAAGGQRDRRLAPRAHQARPLRALAGEQRRLGARPRALLGHAAADLAQRGGRDDGGRLLRGAQAALRRAGRRPAPPVRRRHRDPDARPAASRCAACPR